MKCKSILSQALRPCDVTHCHAYSVNQASGRDHCKSGKEPAVVHSALRDVSCRCAVDKELLLATEDVAHSPNIGGFVLGLGLVKGIETSIAVLDEVEFNVPFVTISMRSF